MSLSYSSCFRASKRWAGAYALPLLIACGETSGGDISGDAGKDTANMRDAGMHDVGAAPQTGCSRPDDEAIVPKQVYYVSTSGDDGNDGLSESTAWRTPAHAEKTATKAGTLIALKRGDTFVMNSALGIHHGGAAGSPIMWDGGFWGSGDRARLQASADRDAPEKAVVNIIGCSHVVFENFIVDGNHTNAFGLVVGGTDSYYSHEGFQKDEDNIVVRDNDVLDCGDENDDYVIAVLIQTWNTDMSNISFVGNRVDGTSNHGVAAYMGRAVHGATPAAVHGLYFGHNSVTNFALNGDGRGTGMVFTQSVIDGVMECNSVTQGDGHSAGIVIAGNEEGTPQNAVIRYNDVRMMNHPAFNVQNGYAPQVKIYGNRFYEENAQSNATVWLNIASGVDYTHEGKTASFEFYHNTIVAGQGNTFMDDTTTPGVTTLKNNLLVNSGSANDGDSCFVANSGNSVDHSHNAYYRPAGGNVLHATENDGSGVYHDDVKSWEPTAITLDPKIVDLSGFDWKLHADSPLVGAGTDVGVTRDLLGVRYQNPPTIGAHASE